MLLSIEKFRALSEFRDDCKYRKDGSDKKPGVYIWGFKLCSGKIDSANDFFPYYVGKHEKDVWARVSENVSELFGGNKASIFNVLDCNQKDIKIGKVHRSYADASKKAKPMCGPALPSDDFPGMLYFPEGLHRIVHFRRDPILKLQLEWMEQNFVVAVLTPSSPDDNVSVLEKCIGNLIGYDRLITKPYKPVACKLKAKDLNGSVHTIGDYSDLFALLK